MDREAALDFVGGAVMDVSVADHSRVRLHDSPVAECDKDCDRLSSASEADAETDSANSVDPDMVADNVAEEL
jgi:hypothetical protein